MQYGSAPVSVYSVSTQPIAAPVEPAPIVPPVLDNQPEFFYQSILDNYDTITASAGTAANAATDTTYDPWQAGLFYGYIDVTLAESASVDYFAIAGHTIAGGVMALYQWTGGAWAAVAVKAVTTTDAQVVTFTAVSNTRFRFAFWSGFVSVSTIKCGLKLQSDRKMFAGHNPALLNQQVSLMTKRTNGAHYPGNRVFTRRYQTDINISYVDPVWIRRTARLFMQSLADGKPFFFRWRPDTYPDDCVYCWASGAAQTTNTGPKDFMNFNLSVEALGA